MKEKGSTEEQERKVIIKYFEYNSSDELQPLLDLVSDDIVAYYPSATLRGKKAYGAHVNKTMTAAKKCFSSHKVVPLRISIQNHHAIVRWRFDYSIKACCCSCTSLEGYNEYDFDNSSGDPKIKMVSTEQLNSPRKPCCGSKPVSYEER